GRVGQGDENVKLSRGQAHVDRGRPRRAGPDFFEPRETSAARFTDDLMSRPTPGPLKGSESRAGPPTRSPEMPRPPPPRSLVASPVPGFPAWRPLACLAVLALAPGCSGSAGAEDKDELVPFVDRRGITSYRYVPKKPPAPPQPAQETRKGPDFVEWQQQ